MQLEMHTKIGDTQRESHLKIANALSEHKRREDELSQAMERLRSEKELAIRQVLMEKEQARNQYEQHIDDLAINNKKQENVITDLRSQTLDQKTVLVQKADVEDQLYRERVRNQEIDAQKSILQREQETASDYILELEDKVYKANKTSLELLRHLKDAEGENETLKNYIIELKQRIAVYIPVKDDPIDKRLAEFINNYPCLLYTSPSPRDRG